MIRRSDRTKKNSTITKNERSGHREPSLEKIQKKVEAAAGSDDTMNE